MPKYQMPLCRVEIALQSLVDGRLCTLLIQRQEDPFKGSWALPGGVLRVDADKNLDAAAMRVTKERLGVVSTNLRQLIAVGAKGRDPRGAQEWGLSVVFYSLVPEGSVEPSAGKRVSDLQWFAADERKPKMAFDHANLVAQAINASRTDVANLQFPMGLVPRRFTLGELQHLCEGILGRGLDKASFRRKLRDRSLVEQVKGEEQRGNAHRPSAIFQLCGPEASGL